jgi:hypothetical protein
MGAGAIRADLPEMKNIIVESESLLFFDPSYDAKMLVDRGKSIIDGIAQSGWWKNPSRLTKKIQTGCSSTGISTRFFQSRIGIFE